MEKTYDLEDWVITIKNEIGVIDRICFDGYIVKFKNNKYGFYTNDEIKRWHGCW